MTGLLAEFLPRFVAALGVNIGIAASALACGLLLGLPLAVGCLLPGLPGRATRLLLALLRAAPSFVLMFFLLNALPQGLQLGPWELAMTPWLAVTLSLAVYASAYVCDNAVEALQQWREGSRLAAALLPMGLVRAFFVMVLSSGFGAAVGVVESTSVTLQQIEALDDPRQRLALMALVVGLYVLLFQAIYALTGRLRDRLLQHVG